MARPAFFTYRRNLPHWRVLGATYFVRWSLHRGQGPLSPEERDTVLDVLEHDDGKRYRLGPYVIMDDHVHVLVTPVGDEQLERILHTWKSVGAHKLQRQHGRHGRVWQDESYDHVIRDDQDFAEKAQYIFGNPWDRWPELTDYRWLAAHGRRSGGAPLSPGTGTGACATRRRELASQVGVVAALYSNLCSLPLDDAARQEAGGISLTYFVLKQLPVLAPTTYAASTPWSPEAHLRDWLLPRVLELTYTSWDLEPFAHDVGYDGPPFRWDPARRFLLRCELDAAFFHLYGLSRDDTDYVMDTFPIVKRNDEKAHGEYRTKRVVLEIYDAMAEAICTGNPYQTRLDPPPADPRVSHPDTRRGKR